MFLDSTAGALAISLLGIAPFVVLILVLTVWKRDLLAGSAVFLFVTIALATLIWRIHPTYLLGGSLKGSLVALDIIVIVTGALLFIDVLKKLRIISSLEHYLYQIAPDTRIQAIFLSWSFGALLEGATGFTTPVMIIAPLLVTMGFSIPAAAAIALTANTVPVSFGALGTPLRIGANGYPVAEILPYAAGMGLALSFIAPLILSWLVSRELPSGGKRTTDENGKSLPLGSTWKFALWCGASFGIPYFLTALVGPEFPSLAGGAVSIVVTLIAAQIPAWRRFFLPTVMHKVKEDDPNHVPLHWWRTVLPFIVLIVLLVFLRLVPISLPISLPGGISHTISLYNPGFALLAIAAFYAVQGRLGRSELLHTANTVGRKLLRTAAVVLFVVATTQVLVNSGHNTSELPSMLEGFKTFLNRETLLVMSPLIGAFAAFVAGSVTVSNLTILPVQWETAMTVGTSGILVVCLQLFGATAGNAMAIATISAVEGALGARRQGRAILSKLLKTIPIYFIAITLVSVVLSIVLYAHFPELITR
jgi:lactate permease